MIVALAFQDMLVLATSANWDVVLNSVLAVGVALCGIANVVIAYIVVRETAKPYVEIIPDHIPVVAPGHQSVITFQVINKGRWYVHSPATDVEVWFNMDPARAVPSEVEE